MPDAFSRRLRTARVAFALLLASLALPTSADGIATLDWTLAETLVALGEPPVAVAQVSDYHSWVGEPRLPAGVTDLGLRSQPNLERLAEQSPGRILLSPMFAAQAPRLERIAPVETLALYTPAGNTWGQMQDLTRRLGDLVERPAAAEALIEDTAAHLEALRQRLPQDTPPLLIVQFMDERHVRVFGNHGLFQAVMDRLGLENAWQGGTSYWGFAQVGLEELLELDARLVVVEPYPIGVEAKLADSALWHRLPSVRDDDLITLPPVWSFGALPSARRFAEQLTLALTDSAAP